MIITVSVMVVVVAILLEDRPATSYISLLAV